jgi:heptosyltransferase I
MKRYESECHCKIVFMKIAIVKLSSLGDIIHTMVVLQFIKKYKPNSEVDWIVEKRFKGVLEGNSNINQIHTVNLQSIKKNKSLKLLFLELSKIKKFGNFDVVIDFQGLIKTAIVAKSISTKKIVGYDWHSVREGFASFVYSQKVNIGYDKNTILRYAKLASEALNIQITHDDLISKQSYLFSRGEMMIPPTPYIVFVAGSTWPSRNYPKEKFVKVANALKNQCLVVWGNNEEKQKAEWMASQSDYIKIMPKLNLDELKYIISHSSLLIGNDTGPSHMSWALNIPSVILFGPTPPERLFQTDINLAIKSHSKINHWKLNKKDFSIKDIRVNDIVKIANNLLKN